MNLIILVVEVICLMILLAVYNGQIINWYQTKDNNWSNNWHWTGLIIRALLVNLILLQVGAGEALLTLFFAWAIYNIIIAKMLHQKWYYLGKTSFIDKVIPNWVTYVGYCVILILSIILIIWN